MYTINNLWDEAEAGKLSSDIQLRVYSSRLLGRDPNLVLHGGGNTSVKVRDRAVTGEERYLLYVKGSGWDLATIEEQGFSPVLMERIAKLADLEVLSDPQMMNELSTSMTRAGAPAPSVETILHGLLPHKYVDHTHADAFLAISNSRDGEKIVRELFAPDTVIVPYVMPGFDLARLCARRFKEDAHPGIIGMVLMNHGIFSFGSSARESYDRMIALVSRAVEYLNRHAAIRPSAAKSRSEPSRTATAGFRRDLSRLAGNPVLLQFDSGERAQTFAARDDIEKLALKGPATPDHVLRTKQLPMLGKSLDEYAQQYEAYFSRNQNRSAAPKTILDRCPRVCISPGKGIFYVGRSASDCAIIRDIYNHTIDIILHADALGGWHALPEGDIFDVEYWDLEQAKLKKAGAPAMFSGEVAIVTGAASGIGKACVDSLLRRGAAVAALDLSPAISNMHLGRPSFLGLQCDITSVSALGDAIDRIVQQFGGVDMAVMNAGIFPTGDKIAALDDSTWRQVMHVNLDANLALFRMLHPLLSLAPNGGRVVVVGSKNVSAPGPGAAAYSASKAALNQLARVAALEWGCDGIRVNSIHPNAVFDTGIWTDEVLTARARHYGLSIDEYKTNNVLRTEVKSRDVAELVAEMCGSLFAKTTGAQIPIDGGNDRVI